MRLFAHSLIPLALSGLGSLPIAAIAQPETPTLAHSQAGMPQLLQADAPTRRLQHTPLAASGGIENESTPWPAANAATAEFPRGHADVVRWEKQQSAQAMPTAPAHPQHHGGQK